MDFAGIINKIINSILDPLTALIMTAAVFYFFWGLAKYIKNAGDEKAKEEGKNIMLYGVIALFVMVSVWGLVNLVKDTFNLDEDIPTPPQFTVGG